MDLCFTQHSRRGRVLSLVCGACFCASWNEVQKARIRQSLVQSGKWMTYFTKIHGTNSLAQRPQRVGIPVKSTAGWPTGASASSATSRHAELLLRKEDYVSKRKGVPDRVCNGARVQAKVPTFSVSVAAGCCPAVSRPGGRWPAGSPQLALWGLAQGHWSLWWWEAAGRLSVNRIHGA